MSDDFLEAARTIRPYLPELLAPEQAQSMDTQLADLLNHSEQDVENPIVEVLTSTDTTRQWTAEFIKLNAPPALLGYQPIPGCPTQPLSGVIKYACPYGDFTYYQRQEGETIPLCKTHHIPLQRC